MMTEEEDARISREYGLTPGEWRLCGWTPKALQWMEVVVDTPGGAYEQELVGRTRMRSAARAMAASKQMIALLERADTEVCEMIKAFHGFAADGEDAPELLHEIRTLLDGLKQKGCE